MIVTAQPNVPVADTVAPQPVIVAPELIVDAMVVPGVNPVPAMWTESPVAPRFGVSVIEGTVILNEADAASKLPSDPVAVTR